MASRGVRGVATSAWVVLAFAACPAWGARVTSNEVAHFSFQYASCAAGAGFPDAVQPSNALRTLQMGSGASCEDRHVGLVMNSTCDARSSVAVCGYAPLTTTGGAFFGGVTAGFTLELWLKPSASQRTPNDPNLQSPSLVIAAVGTFGNENTDPCGDGFRLMQDERGCLQLMLEEPGPHCEDAVLLGIRSEIGPPVVLDCAAALDLRAPKTHHVVVSASSDWASIEAGVGGANFAVYLDGARVVDARTGSTATLTNAGRSSRNLWRQYFVQDRRHNEQPVSPLVSPAALWNAPGAKLHLGADGTTNAAGDGPNAATQTIGWFGTVYQLALYSSPLTDEQVSANFAAGLDNSAPVASDGSYSVAEDACAPLAPVAALLVATSVSDYDTDVLGRAQNFTVYATAGGAPSPNPSRGKLYSDASCTSPLPNGSTAPLAALYYRGAPDENAAELSLAHYADLAWAVTDGAGGSATATLAIDVTPVNDPPEPIDTSGAFAYVGLPATFTVAGTDVDATPPGSIASAQLQVVTFPAHGSLYAPNADGSPGQLLTAASDTVPNISLVYVSQPLPQTGEVRPPCSTRRVTAA